MVMAGNLKCILIVCDGEKFQADFFEESFCVVSFVWPYLKCLRQNGVQKSNQDPRDYKKAIKNILTKF